MPNRRMQCALCFILLASAWVALALPAVAQSPFYVASPAELPGQPGSIIRTEPMSGAPDGAAAYRVLYRSTGLQGQPIAVSGVVIVPDGPVPPGGRPIIAWAHPTTGVEPRCAPSLALFVFQQIQGSRTMVQEGYVVAATDYPGLGTPGPHPYLVGVSEARAVIDSVRAARSIAGDDAQSHFAAWGHSQGGQAALFTGLIAKDYAPELTLTGIAVAAPATELGILMKDDMQSSGGKNLTAMTLWSWSRVFGAPITSVVESQAIPVIDALASECIESIFDVWERRRTSRPLAEHFLSVDDLTSIEPWHRILVENTPGMLPPSIPVFIAQGTADQLVRPQVTEDYMSRLCRNGSRVRMHWMPNVGHGFAGAEAALPAIDWMGGRFAGSQPASDCAN